MNTPASVPLKDLEATFQRLVGPGEHEECDDISKAQGVFFMCPKCFVANGGPIGTHWVLCWFKDRGVPDEEDPKPGRWHPHGTGVHDLELKAGSSSILLRGGCNWHGFIRNGRATLG